MVKYHQPQLSETEAIALLKESYSQHPSWETIIPVLVNEGFEAMAKACVLSPGNEHENAWSLRG